MIRQLCEYVAQAAGRAISPSKPIVGSGIFMHESGVHADGVLKHPETYEPFAPSDVGGVRQLVIGKHSGRASIKAKFAEFGISVADEHAVRVLEEVRKKAVELKRPLFDKELMYIYYNTGGTAGRGG
jgi:homocitrate synthase NifV